jgi:hypothetical protein
MPESWMLILDNADDPDIDLFPHFPLGDRGTILITSRNPECRIHATAGVCELGRMEEEEATTLMLKTVGHEDLSDEAAREIAKSAVSILGYLALAIDQAGAVVRQGLYTMEEYRKVGKNFLTESLFNAVVTMHTRFTRLGTSRFR